MEFASFDNKNVLSSEVEKDSNLNLVLAADSRIEIEPSNAVDNASSKTLSAEIQLAQIVANTWDTKVHYGTGPSGWSAPEVKRSGLGPGQGQAKERLEKRVSVDPQIINACTQEVSGLVKEVRAYFGPAINSGIREFAVQTSELTRERVLGHGNLASAINRIEKIVSDRCRETGMQASTRLNVEKTEGRYKNSLLSAIELAKYKYPDARSDGNKPDITSVFSRIRHRLVNGQVERSY